MTDLAIVPLRSPSPEFRVLALLGALLNHSSFLGSFGHIPTSNQDEQGTLLSQGRLHLAHISPAE